MQEFKIAAHGCSLSLWGRVEVGGEHEGVCHVR